MLFESRHTMKQPIRKIALAWLAVWLVLAHLTFARSVTDMVGRTVEVPETIHRIYGTTPPATSLTYAVSPERVACLNMPMQESGKKYLDPAVLELPVAGGWFGQGHTPNMENLLTVNPDLILVWQPGIVMKNTDIINALKPLNVPVVFVALDRVEDYPKAFRFMGELLGEQDRTEVLAQYVEKVLADMNEVRTALSQESKVTVYYAENSDGLSTECRQSVHAQLIPLCGGVNVHQGVVRSRQGLDKVFMEQVLLYNPQVIVAHSLAFYQAVFTDTRWASIQAVRDKRVYLIPTAPMNWFDRPPSFMRLIGARWMTHTLYPALYPMDMEQGMREFYELFLGYTLTQADIEEILGS